MCIQSTYRPSRTIHVAPVPGRTERFCLDHPVIRIFRSGQNRIPAIRTTKKYFEYDVFGLPLDNIVMPILDIKN